MKPKNKLYYRVSRFLILRSNATSNQYTLIINGKPTTVYCLMDDPNSCGGGGWTTVMKIIGETVQ